VVFDKQGNVLQGPVPDTTFWGGLAQTCDQLGGFSDPVVKYDRVADRWIVGEVALPFITQFIQCFAVSKTSDPTFTSDASGANTSYYIWAYGFGTHVNDYDKIAVWPDGYYVNWNIFDAISGNFLYPEACAWNRNDMLAGVAKPRFVCFNLSNNYASLLASDWDGSSPPPAGAPNYLMEVDTATGVLEEWRFHVDYTTPGNSTLTGPTVVSGVAAFSTPCPVPADPDNCIPQPGTTQNLESLSDRLMYRLAYRNFGDHESIVANHTVGAGANTGVRWYEVRNPGATPTVYQQGTFAPDSDSRWMASIAMDKSGNIGVGYSVSSASTHPSIRYSGWEAGNPLGILQAETHLVDGGGSQTAINRWGDYSAMQIDPADDCTFWYTQEYEAATQSTDWNTRIGSFKFSSCGQALTATTTGLSSGQNPSTYGQTVTFTATVSPSAATGSVTFKDGATTIGTVVLNAGTAQLQISTLTAGSHSITATYGGNSAYASSTSTPALVQNVQQAATSITLASSGTSTYGNPVTFTATVTSGGGTPAGTVTFNDGNTAIGTVALSGGQAKLSTSTLSVGVHSITATFNGSTNFAGSGPSNTVSQTVNQVTTTTTLVSSLNPSGSGQLVTFTATVTPATAGGTVTFFIDGSATSPVSLGAGNKAAYSTSTLSVGQHTITATYNGDTNDKFSNSNAVNQTVNSAAAGFGISASPPSQSVTRGSQTTYTVSITPTNGFSGTVKFSVSGLPSRATGSFNPSSVTGSGQSILTISTNSKTRTGTRTLTITGTSGALSHATTVQLTVN
jgi:hypothetical protein